MSAYKDHLTPQQRFKVSEALDILVKKAKRSGKLLNDPNSVKSFLRLEFSKYDQSRETFTLIMLNNRHKLISVIPLFTGSVDSAEVYPRIVVKAVLDCEACAVILAHNHPSGHLEPSASDHALTARLKSALNLVDVRVIDHFIVTPTETTSFAERGWL